MPYLSNPITDIKEHYTVVVVGSGYGGGIAASRLARAGQKVCVLERGKEFQPGEFPDTLSEVKRELQIDTPDGHTGSPTNLYDFRFNDDMHVFVGCGLGGTSLVNANVSLPAEPRVLEDARWPRAFREDSAGLEAGYERAREMLKPTPYPAGSPPLPKLVALEKSAKRLGEKFYRPPINVNFTVNGPNHVGVEQKPCSLCGDCVCGCNYGAKNTVAMNYLPDAKNFGAEIFTRVSVRRVERKDGRWLVHFQLLGAGRETFDAPTLMVGADVVILAAGTLGSTEILMRSRDAGLDVSAALGERFTGNGDVLAFGYNNDDEIRGVGYGHRPPSTMDATGPCIAGIIDAREKENLDHGMVIEDGSIPGSIASVVMPMLSLARVPFGEDTDWELADELREKGRELKSIVGGQYTGSARNTQTYLVMSHDGGTGKLALADDRLRVVWPGVGDQPVFTRINEQLYKASAALGGTHLPNPLGKLTDHDLVTVHPLGGCVMGEDATGGVVNHKGQVYSGKTGTSVHDGLYVCDGAVIPRSLGVNPLLTISAVAERCCALLAADRNWRIDYTLPSVPKEPPIAQRLGVQFTETMRGRFSKLVKDDFAKGFESGEQFEFTLTVISDDLEEMLTSPAHNARMLGTVLAPSLSATPMTATEGQFNLFVRDPGNPRQRLMVYGMKMTASDGRSFFMEGFKAIKDDPGPDAWADTTTLYITVRDGNDASAPVLGTGILHIGADDFQKQMSTFEITNAKSAIERLDAKLRFGRFFAGALFDIYGGIFSKNRVLDSDVPARKRRPLRLPAAPEVHFFKTQDDVTLRLIRYRAGTKGPVILAPGFGTSTLAFRLDSIETSLSEYLCAHGYDVWLFDYRASPELSASRTQFTLDDIALYDWPAAVGKVQEVTGAFTVQALGHCVASVTLSMALLAGLKGVRAAICSQFMPHVRVPFLERTKAGLYLASLVQAAGIDFLTTDYDRKKFMDRVYDKVLRLYPSKERCTNPVCRRILFMYGEVFRHDQLNRVTHDEVHALFGAGNLRSFKHIARMIRERQAVHLENGEAYLKNVAKINGIRMAFLQGARNGLFRSTGTQLTYEQLCKVNGPELYSRYVIEDYGHMDCFIGKNAANDVFPVILQELEKEAFRRTPISPMFRIDDPNEGNPDRVRPVKA